VKASPTTQVPFLYVAAAASVAAHVTAYKRESDYFGMRRDLSFQPSFDRSVAALMLTLLAEQA